MSRRALVLVLAGLWAVLFAWSFVYFHATAPTDMGFTRGLNRVAGFLGWQGLALLAALAALFAGAGAPKQDQNLRWLSRAPILGELCLIAAITLFAAYGLLRPQTPAREMPPAVEPIDHSFG